MSYNQLSEKQRYHIELCLKKGMCQKDIAEQIGKHPSTISREIKRNMGKKGYRHKQAHRKAMERHKNRNKAIKLTDKVISWISLLLKQDFSPEQIVGRLFLEIGITLHHETIYRFIYQDKVNGGNLWQHLRIVVKPYRKRYGSGQDKRGKIPNRVSIHNRPNDINERVRLGDFEADTVIGKNRKGALLTLVDRKSLYTLIVKLAGKQADKLANEAIDVLTPIQEQVHSITFDNGLEFTRHEQIARALNITTYFADPYASWQRGANENTNGLIRQYFPKDTDFHDITDEQVKTVQNKLNNRPRKTRGFKTPNELFFNKTSQLLVA